MPIATVGEVLLTPKEMSAADAATIATGTPGIVLMERAGLAVANAARRMWRGGSILVLAGPGNNGGDGFVSARILRDAGYRVTVLLKGERDRLRGDAAEAAARFAGVVRTADPSLLGVVARQGNEVAGPAASDLPAQPEALERPGLIIDALYGAGVRLPLDPEAAALIDAVNALTSGAPAAPAIHRPRDRPLVLAVDLPSGVDGATGAVSRAAIRADATITFQWRKPGHVLLPGRGLCGPITVADIGIAPDVLVAIAPTAFSNTPAAWRAAWPRLDTETHKYRRGHALVVSGPPDATGAARLAAMAALRVGAGAVTVAAPPDAVAANAVHLTAVMLRAFDGPEGLAGLLGRRAQAIVIGPAAGVGEGTAALVEVVLASGAAVVLDADALTSFAGEPGRLFDAIARSARPVVMTPHDGEFGRLFPEIIGGSRLERARAAARRSGATVISKGADTVVAAGGASERATIAENAPPTLATAGSGDVLAGLVGGLLAQGMPPFEAASAAVWLHGEAGSAIGPGLIAEDLPAALPLVLRRLWEGPSFRP